MSKNKKRSKEELIRELLNFLEQEVRENDVEGNEHFIPGAEELTVQLAGTLLEELNEGIQEEFEATVVCASLPRRAVMFWLLAAINACLKGTITQFKKDTKKLTAKDFIDYEVRTQEESNEIKKQFEKLHDKYRDGRFDE